MHLGGLEAVKWWAAWDPWVDVLGELRSWRFRTYQSPLTMGQVILPKPQDSLMWEAFCHAVLQGREKGHWAHIARLTQQVVLAIDLSAKLQGKTVRVADLSQPPAA